MGQTAEKIKQQVFERGDNLYIVSPVAPFEPGPDAIEEFAFAQELKKLAPNPNFLWLKGQYVEADNPNANGQVWTADEIAIKSLTPMYTPVTVMHDPTTAVGLIADTRLLLPSKDGVPRARIDSTLAIWAHRFPEVAEEIAANFEAGTLMQSMECKSPFYSCGECGMTFHKRPDGSEKAGWCSHLEESANASRILGGVTFTGTGLIFGTRGTRGAYDEAHLDIFQEELAAAHEESHRPDQKRNTRRAIPVEKMEIERDEYTKLIARPTREELAAAETRAEEAESKVKDAESAAEQAEIAKKAAEDEKAELQKKVDKVEEDERASELSTTRLGALGKGFKSALPEGVSKRLAEQAGKFSDEEWSARLDELESLTDKKRDEGGDENADESGENGEVTAEETASANLGGGTPSNGGAPSEAARKSVVGGLLPKS